MSFLLENFNWIWVVAAGVSGGLLVVPALKGSASAGGVSPAEAVRLINREKAVVIDVSEPGEFAAGHVIGARNIPLGQLDASGDLPSNKALPLVVLCASGNRAARAVRALQAKGHAGAVVVVGGLSGWKAAGLPVEAARKA